MFEIFAEKHPHPFFIRTPTLFIKFLKKMFTSKFFTRTLFYWNSYSSIYFLRDIWKILNSDLNAINDWTLSFLQ